MFTATIGWKTRRAKTAGVPSGGREALRRQKAPSGGGPGGGSRDERLDPFGLPLHIELTDRAGDERMRLVELRRERVVLHRVSRGIKMALNLRVAAYLGVAIRMEPPACTAAGAVALVLEHP